MDGYFGAPAHLRKATPTALDAQARCDAIQAEFHAEPERRSIRRDPPPVAPAQIPTDDVLKLRLAEEVEFARRMIDQMGETLSGDPIVVGRHMVSLQSVDVAGQILGHIANILRSSDPDGAVELVGMCDLKARLKRNSIC